MCSVSQHNCTDRETQLKNKKTYDHNEKVLLVLMQNHVCLHCVTCICYADVGVCTVHNDYSCNTEGYTHVVI